MGILFAARLAEQAIVFVKLNFYQYDNFCDDTKEIFPNGFFLKI
jgi:hypothetical protein